MDEKDAIRKIRNSLRAGKSDAEIIRILHGRGYKLEYIYLLVKRARRRKVIFLFFSGFLFLILAFFIFVGVVIYSVLFVISGEKMVLMNPLSGININFGMRDVSFGVNSSGVGESFGDEVYIEDIEITADFISYLLNEIGAWRLRPNPITGEIPSIDFVIDGEEFNSVIDGEIVTFDGLGDDSDVVFYSNKYDIVRAMLSESPDEIFKESYNEGKSSLEVKKSEPELFMKGYLGFYDSLNN